MIVRVVGLAPAARAARAGLAAIPVIAALAILSVTGCSSGDDVPARKQAILERASRETTRQLETALSSGRAAVAGIQAALAKAGDSPTARFEALEALRKETRVDGLYSDDPGGVAIWAGVPVEPKELPDPPPPWAESFASGDVTYHAGPFLSALVVRTERTGGGAARADVVLAETGTSTSPFAGTVDERWAEKLGVRAVRILPPDALERPVGASVRRSVVASAPGGPPLLVIEVEAPPDSTIAARLAEETRRTHGWIALAGLALATLSAFLAIWRWVPDPGVRGLCVAALSLVLRAALHALDLASRFPEAAAAFRTDDFGVTGFLGWLSNPGEFLLTGAALLATSFGLARFLSTLPPDRRTAVRAAQAVAGIALIVIGVKGWLFLVKAATVHSQVDFFAPGTLVPSPARSLLLGGLAAATAAGWILARVGMKLAVQAVGRGTQLASLAVALLAGILAWRVGGSELPAWAPFLLPLAAALVGHLAPGGPRPGAPSRILLVSVLSTALLFPVLWASGSSAYRATLRSQVEDLVSRPASLESRLRLKLEGLADDAVLLRALTRQAREMVAPEGLALYAWQKLGFGDGREEAVVVLYDGKDQRFDRFGISAPLYRRLPDPRPDAENDGDPITVVEAPWTRARVAATIGRARIKSPDGKILGTVAVVVPDALTVGLQGFSPLIELKSADSLGERRASPNALSLVKGGRVVLSSDPELPLGDEPPIDLKGVVEPTWLPPTTKGGAPWLAVPAGDRGVVLARPDDRTLEDELFGLARVSIVGVGLGLLVASIALLASLKKFRARLQDKILWSYFAISVVPLVFLGYANWRDAMQRSRDDFDERLASTALSARAEIERTPTTLFDVTESGLGFYAEARGLDLLLYRGGTLQNSTLPGLADAELLPWRLTGTVFVATEIEGRDLVVHEERLGGRRVKVGYTPVRDQEGRPLGTLAVPLTFDTDRAEQRASETGSVLLAAYFLTLVLVVVIGIYTARGLARRIGRLADATKRVASGELELTLPGAGRDEIGSLVDAFNAMTSDLKEAREQAAKAERETAWRGMARQVAHEIKNPLTPMKLMLQQLVAASRGDPLSAAQAVEPTAKVVLEQIDALTRIANDFSAFARFPPRSLLDVDVNDVLRSVATLYSGGESEGAEVVADLAEGLPAVRWDRDELRRIFVNLVANAVQAMDPCRAHVRVEIRSRASTLPGTAEPAILVTVADDGVGIPEDSRGRLFEPDFSTKTHGTGLGLAIVKRILLDLGGEIRIDSVPGEGTTVSTWLPVAAHGLPAFSKGTPAAADGAGRSPDDGSANATTG